MGTSIGSNALLPLPPGEGRGEGVLSAARGIAGSGGTWPCFGRGSACLPSHPGPLPEGEGEASGAAARAAKASCLQHGIPGASSTMVPS